MAERSDRSLKRRKTRDWAVILPLTGVLLFMPPLAGVIPTEKLVAGLPATVLYIFAVWFALILGAALLARRIRRDGAPEDLETPAPPRDDPQGGVGP